ncbi:hypothetical protein FPF71_13300 [Algibacter amylolyticus]|uniref:Uncharacterized protein n=1 Tax=Algibacter amylolyticus TaxID=1608400 RepID=A0A5M7B5M7_9FLAO|nr:hypothetical protein [Algibacter amylolyticus]KAA5823668.1 hypothetical protein F2B50_13300 [Algibacter amylolyticus]MBB5267831.1 hypothetical protein [Algibacter amylolyticus]TSJ74156.1 hypothetical protein FPF71_13300 [Algibacter amylolyticus]
MDDITVIYRNDFGLVFWWKRCAVEDYKKINLVFNNTALHFTALELLTFLQHIETSINKLITTCNSNNQEQLMLLETPAPQVSFVLNYEDLIGIENLVIGTLYELELNTGLKHYKNQNTNRKNKF